MIPPNLENAAKGVLGLGLEHQIHPNPSADLEDLKLHLDWACEVVEQVLRAWDDV